MIAKNSKFQSATTFLISIFLIVTLLTSFILIPKINELFEKHLTKDSEKKLKVESELLRHFVDKQLSNLQTFGDNPVIINATLSSSVDAPDFNDLIENYSMLGDKPRITLQNINTDIIYQSEKNIIGSYEDQPWVRSILKSERQSRFTLLSQTKDKITISLSVPIKNDGNIVGLLSSEITLKLLQIFSPNLTDKDSAIKIEQNKVTAESSTNHILIPHEISTTLIEPNLTLSLIHDDSLILETKAQLKKYILIILFSGLAISFVLLVLLLAYRTLGSDDKRKSLPKLNFARLYLIPIIVGIVGLTASISTHLFLKNIYDEKIEKSILTKGNKYSNGIRQEISSNLQALRSTKSFYDSLDNIGHDEFRSYTRAILDYNYNIQAISWIPKVSHDEREHYEAQARKEGLKNFHFTKRQDQGKMVIDSERESYFPIYYIEPLEENLSAVGFNLGSDETKLASLHNARDSGKLVATAPTTLPQKNQKAILIISPVYADLTFYNNSKQRQENLRGYITTLLRISDLVERVTGDYAKHILIKDITNKPTIIYGIETDDLLSKIKSSRVINVAGRIWRIDVAADAKTLSLKNSFLPWISSIIILIFTTFIVFSLIHLIRRRQAIENIVEHRTEELGEVKHFQELIMSNIPDLLFVRDESLKLVQTNPAYQELYPELEKTDGTGRVSFKLHKKEQAENIIRNHNEALDNQSSETEEIINLNNGETKTFLTKRVRFHDTRGERFVLGIARDITNIKQAETALQESEKRYEVSVRGSAIGLWDWSLQTDELFWSDRFKQILGITDNNFQARFEDFSSRLHPDDKEQVFEKLSNHLKHKTDAYEAEHRLRCNDNHYVWLKARGQAVWDASGKAIRVAGSVDDISDKKSAEEEILRSNMELERFAYVASHDLQEPLRMVISFTNLLEKRYAEQLDDKAKEYINFASSSALRMQELVQDLLEYARLGHEAEWYNKVNLNDTIKLIHQNLHESIKDSNAQITHDHLPTLHTNPVRMTRLLQNLIGNSIKYHDNNEPPKIHIKAEQLDTHWLFEITDNGIGMQQEYCEKIFEPFKRLHGKNEFSGTGMGLAICRKIVEGFGGEISARSELGKGSTFCFTVSITNENHNETQDKGDSEWESAQLVT